VLRKGELLLIYPSGEERTLVALGSTSDTFRMGKRSMSLSGSASTPWSTSTLKRALGINDTKWRTFKAKFIEGSSTGELA
jgi:hypothetical protein